MEFPDLPYLRQLQRDLHHWPSSRATVMVGSGFSLNSVPSPGSTSSFPTWSELARSMFDEIYPACTNETAEQKKGREKKFNQSSALRIASEYEATFDRHGLESLIETCIPDAEHQPGPLHHHLLELPWRDVFTTNYDTLLERTEVSRRTYKPVVSVGDLTNANSPRIIKLHGSFLSNTRLIVTEEDYRKYPSDFAPFVNTVRQALIETSFVLIGFSGNDPNFLQWIGWIRDVLGDNHSSIYLVSTFSLSLVERSLLRDRKVKPIDLTPVYSGITQNGDRHSIALEWFLKCLAAAKHQRPESWPGSKNFSGTSAENLPIPILGGKIEPDKVKRPDNSTTLKNDETILQVINRWRFEKREYPGWLIPTNEIRYLLWKETKDWLPVLLKSTENWSDIDRLMVFREINWRLEVAMVPLFNDWIEDFELVTNSIFSTIENEASQQISFDDCLISDVSNTDIVDAWFEISFGLLREAREVYNAKRWNSLIKMIDKMILIHPRFLDRSQYEKALWHMWNIERGEARSVVVEWQPSLDSPLAVIWKGGLLAELGDLREARSLLQSALKAIRNSLNGSQKRSIDLLSLEGWCTYVLFYIEVSLDFTSAWDIRQEYLERWQELKEWDCNPLPLKQYFSEILTDTPPDPKEGKQVTREFDPGVTRTTHHLSGLGTDPWLPAFACVRLYEQVGIPLHLPNVQIAGVDLRNACKWISPFIGFWSPALLIRAGKKEDLAKHGFISRVQIANMDQDLVERLNKWAMNALKMEILSLNGKISSIGSQETLLETLVEVLSRLSFRLKDSSIQEAFSLAIELHTTPGIPSHRSLSNFCTPWFKRLFDSVENEQLYSWLPELIKFPLHINRERFDTSPIEEWEDPLGDSFPIAKLLAYREGDIRQNSSVIDAIEWLLENARLETDEWRGRALMRLFYVHQINLMSKEQLSKYEKLLWGDTGESELPDLPNLRWFAYMLLPGAKKFGAEHILKEKILNAPDISNMHEVNPVILNAACMAKGLIQIPHEEIGKIEWSMNEAYVIWKKVIKWWEKEQYKIGLERISPFGGTGNTESILRYTSMFLVRAILPNMHAAKENEWEEVSGYLSQTRKYNIHQTWVLRYVLIHYPRKTEETVQEIFDGVISDNERAVIASAIAIRHWIHLADAGHLEFPSESLVDKLIHRVVFRLPHGIHQSMRQLALLLHEKPNVFKIEQVNLIVSSLPAWDLNTIVPPASLRLSEIPEEERPDLRTNLGYLASALNNWLAQRNPNQAEPEEIAKFRESCINDPLPEVRRSFDIWDD